MTRSRKRQRWRPMRPTEPELFKGRMPRRKGIYWMFWPADGGANEWELVEVIRGNDRKPGVYSYGEEEEWDFEDGLPAITFAGPLAPPKKPRR